MIVFAKGAWYALNDLCCSGYDVVGLDWSHDPAEAVRTAAGRVVLQGNADPGVLYGSDQEISDEVSRMMQGFGGGRQGWIANLGHGEYPRCGMVGRIDADLSCRYYSIRQARETTALLQ